MIAAPPGGSGGKFQPEKKLMRSLDRPLVSRQNALAPPMLADGKRAKWKTKRIYQKQFLSRVSVFEVSLVK